ncbi:hypothetical protein [Rhodanobacter denitrificans]|uniref:hypothetical protein n=1 Tax=Rhodanobacter denitrificans TaxID=666685 RepID=UPI001F482C63|nr:hypothetical protein [Rhodanobacter denitrificans]UJJ60613.1 hypothetical protein LRK55_19455 [Rhodanobacter denitrificans]
MSTAAPVALSLTINGQIYVTSAEALRHARTTGQVVAGCYKRDRCGVRLYGLDGEPFAYIRFDRFDSWFVSCSRLDGRVRYMFALSDRDTKRLGFDPSAEDTWRRKRDVAAAVCRQVAAYEQSVAA